MPPNAPAQVGAILQASPADCGQEKSCLSHVGVHDCERIFSPVKGCPLDKSVKRYCLLVPGALSISPRLCLSARNDPELSEGFSKPVIEILAQAHVVLQRS